MSDDEEGRRSSTVTIRKVKSLLNEERKSINDELSQRFDDFSKSLCTEIAKSLKSSLVTEIKESLATELTEGLSVSIMTGIEKLIKTKFAEFEIKVATLEKKIENNASDLGKIRSEIENVSLVNESQANEIEQLKRQNSVLQKQSFVNQSMLNKIDELEERVEERTNRSLRQTMIFRGIPENTNEKWSDTKHLLAELIADNCDVTYEDANTMINRAHRGGAKVANKHRPIYANFWRWDVTQDIISGFRESNIQNPGFRIFAEYKFGPKTTMRRRDALKLRKDLKHDGEIVSGYIKYPARLMVKFSQNDKHYKMHTDFSKAPVDFSKSSLRNPIE